MTRMVYCRGCAAEIHETALACPKCGAQQGINSGSININGSNGMLILLLCIFFGMFGLHRFATGKIGTGILMLITFGGFTIWWLIDTIMIITGNYSDKSGKKVTL
ncbi:MAG: TM2 domain-containing protein [Oceanospirillaceae bacterium]|nr:TM2 domain-containing protein [Oceanospirillaceae bacterium]MCP5335242.1 TM2 domain-containing protein [Oceanospirillaceae bacterium]